MLSVCSLEHLTLTIQLVFSAISVSSYFPKIILVLFLTGYDFKDSLSSLFTNFVTGDCLIAANFISCFTPLNDNFFKFEIEEGIITVLCLSVLFFTLLTVSFACLFQAIS